jgi:hypothetical protein
MSDIAEDTMKSLAGRIVIALVLLSIAAIAFTEARWLRHAADIHERLATLRDERVDAGSSRRLLPAAIVGTGGADTVATAKADYWRGSYDALGALSTEADRDPDPELLLLAANAAYRRAERERLPRQGQLDELEAVLQAYASALKASRFVADAAYNYEFVARMRESLGRSRPSAAAPSPAPKSAARAGDLPLGPTIHGRPGGPPPGTKGEQFEILTPMEFGERESQPEPTSGGRPLRKG